MRAVDQYQTGFTLVELVVVIVIIGAVGVGIVNFIGRSTQGYIDTALRQQLATVGWVMSEKVSRDIRDALPNSFRPDTGGPCLEFIPTVAGSDYIDAPVDPILEASVVEVIEFPNYTTPGVNERVAIYPSSVTDLYRLLNPGIISSGTITSLTAGTDANSRDVNLSSAHQFLTDSPTRRMYVTGEPVLYCFVGTQLLRYSGYGFNDAIPDPIADGLTGEVVGSGILAGSGTFSYAPGTLSRTGVVNFNLTLREDDTDHLIDQEVQIRNVP